MKLIYAQGFSKTEKLEWKPVVLINVIQSLRLIFDAMEDYSIDFERKENEVSCSPGVAGVGVPVAAPHRACTTTPDGIVGRTGFIATDS